MTALEMANGDPLRAKEIYAQIDKLWALRWMTWRHEKAEADRKKAGKGK